MTTKACCVYGMAISLAVLFVSSRVSAATAEDEAPVYLELRMYEGARDSREPNSLSRCIVSGGRVCNGAYLSEGQSTALSVGGEPLLATQHKTVFEVLFGFTVEMYPDSTVLVGNIYSIDVAPDGSITGGSKKVLRHAAAFDQPFDLVLRPATGPAPLRLEYRLIREIANEEITFGRNTITIKSLYQAPGVTQKFSSTADLRTKGKRNALFGRQEDPIVFDAAFTTGDHPHDAVDYSVQIEFDPPLARQEYPARTTMVLRRVYSVGGTSMDGKTGFTYRKPIELVKGKMLKLVFPPDDVARDEFKITDTVIINP